MTRKAATPAKLFEVGDVAECHTTGLERLVERMQAVLEGLEARTLPDDRDYTCEDLRAYLRSLVQGQRGELSWGAGCGHVVAGSWGVNVDCDRMPSDARVEFVFFPTYIAVATLSRCVLQFPLLSASVEGLVPALHRGMTFACGRNLEGHGYDADADKERALNLLYMGWVPLLLWQNPDFCPPMAALLEKTPHIDFHVGYELRMQYQLQAAGLQNDLHHRRLLRAAVLARRESEGALLRRTLDQELAAMAERDLKLDLYLEGDPAPESPEALRLRLAGLLHEFDPEYGKTLALLHRSFLYTIIDYERDISGVDWSQRPAGEPAPGAEPPTGRPVRQEHPYPRQLPAPGEFMDRLRRLVLGREWEDRRKNLERNRAKWEAEVAEALSRVDPENLGFFEDSTVEREVEDPGAPSFDDLFAPWPPEDAPRSDRETDAAPGEELPDDGPTDPAPPAPPEPPKEE